MARQDTMSAWFWITNSWLSTGGLLFFLRKPMAHRRGSTFRVPGRWVRGGAARASVRHWVLPPPGLELACPRRTSQPLDVRAAPVAPVAPLHWTAARVLRTGHEDALTAHRRATPASPVAAAPVVKSDDGVLPLQTPHSWTAPSRWRSRRTRHRAAFTCCTEEAGVQAHQCPRRRRHREDVLCTLLSQQPELCTVLLGCLANHPLKSVL